MGVDTRDKRMSMVGLASPIRRLFQNPTGTIGAAARAMLEFLYSGIGLAPPVAPVVHTVTFTSWNVADAFRSWNTAGTMTTWEVPDTFTSWDA